MIKRPEIISGDLTPTIDVIEHVLKEIKDPVEDIVLLQPTNPMRPADLLTNSYEIFKTQQHDSLFTVSRIDKKLGKIKNKVFKPYNYTPGQRSQDLKPLYYENGLLYIAKIDAKKEVKLISDNSFPYIIEHPFAKVDIDFQEDLDFAEFLYKKYFE